MKEALSSSALASPLIPISSSSGAGREPSNSNGVVGRIAAPSPALLGLVAVKPDTGEPDGEEDFLSNEGESSSAAFER